MHSQLVSMHLERRQTLQERFFALPQALRRISQWRLLMERSHDLELPLR